MLSCFGSVSLGGRNKSNPGGPRARRQHCLGGKGGSGLALLLFASVRFFSPSTVKQGFLNAKIRSYTADCKDCASQHVGPRCSWLAFLHVTDERPRFAFSLTHAFGVTFSGFSFTHAFGVALGGRARLGGRAVGGRDCRVVLKWTYGHLWRDVLF